MNLCKFTDEQEQYIVDNRMDKYPSDIAKELGLKEYQIRWYLYNRNLEYKRKYKTDGDLTDRETEVYNYLLSKGNLQDIADAMFLSRASINSYCTTIFSKKMVNSRVELMAQRIKELEDELNRTQQVLNSYYASNQ